MKPQVYIRRAPQTLPSRICGFSSLTIPQVLWIEYLCTRIASQGKKFRTLIICQLREEGLVYIIEIKIKFLLLIQEVKSLR